MKTVVHIGEYPGLIAQFNKHRVALHARTKPSVTDTRIKSLQSQRAELASLCSGKFLAN